MIPCNSHAHQVLSIACEETWRVSPSRLFLGSLDKTATSSEIYDIVDHRSINWQQLTAIDSNSEIVRSQSLLGFRQHCPAPQDLWTTRGMAWRNSWNEVERKTWLADTGRSWQILAGLHVHFFESVVPSCCQVSFHMSGTEAVMCVPTSEQKDVGWVKKPIVKTFRRVLAGKMWIYDGNWWYMWVVVSRIE